MARGVYKQLKELLGQGWLDYYKPVGINPYKNFLEWLSMRQMKGDLNSDDDYIQAIVNAKMGVKSDKDFNKLYNLNAFFPVMLKVSSPDGQFSEHYKISDKGMQYDIKDWSDYYLKGSLLLKNRDGYTGVYDQIQISVRDHPEQIVHGSMSFKEIIGRGHSVTLSFGEYSITKDLTGNPSAMWYSQDLDTSASAITARWWNPIDFDASMYNLNAILMANGVATIKPI